MADRFLKFIPSEEAFWLLENHPRAFLLFTHIANTARRTEGSPDGLSVGQCHLKASAKYGFTEREYRTAKEVLVTRGHIKIVQTNRTRQKSTTGKTTKSTLVEITSLTIYDINPESNDNRNDNRETTERQLKDNKQEGIRKKKKEEEEQPHTPSKIKFREFVELTQEEHDTLLGKHGPEVLNLMLDKLNSYKGSSGKKYSSDYHTMKEGGWVIIQVRKELENQKAPHDKFFQTPPKTPTGNTPNSETKFYPSRVIGREQGIEENSGIAHG